MDEHIADAITQLLEDGTPVTAANIQQFLAEEGVDIKYQDIVDGVLDSDNWYRWSTSWLTVNTGNSCCVFWMADTTKSRFPKKVV